PREPLGALGLLREGQLADRDTLGGEPRERLAGARRVGATRARQIERAVALCGASSIAAQLVGARQEEVELVDLRQLGVAPPELLEIALGAAIADREHAADPGHVAPRGHV